MSATTMNPAPSAILVWTPLEAQHAFDDHAECDHGPLWSIARVPQQTTAGERAAVLRSGPGGALVGVFCACGDAFEVEGLGSVAWGIQSLTAAPVARDGLLDDPVLGELVARVREPQRLTDEQAQALAELIGEPLPAQRPDEPTPEPQSLADEDAPAPLGVAPLETLVAQAGELCAETAGAMIDMAMAAGLDNEQITLVAEGRAELPPPEAVGRRALLGEQQLLQAALGDGIASIASQVESCVLLAAALEVEEDDVAAAFGMPADDELLEYAPPADRSRLLAGVAAGHEACVTALLRLARGAGLTQEDLDRFEDEGLPLQPPEDPEQIEAWIVALPPRDRALLELGRFFEAQELLMGIVAEQGLETGLDEPTVAAAIGAELVEDDEPDS